VELTARTLADCPDDESAYRLLEELRWHGEPVCPFCGHDKAYFLKPANGRTRATGPKKTMSVRRVWKCAKCRRQFSVLTNTIMHGSKISLRTWLAVLVDVSSAKNGVSAREIARKYEITPESAWHMLHRVREAMRRDPLAGMLRGTIIADETYIGGLAKNKHAGAEYVEKTAVLSLVDTETGEVRSQVIPTVDGAHLRKAISEHVDMRPSVLVTDELRAYKTMSDEFTDHISVNHSDRQYKRHGVSTNRIEGFFSQLKRSLDGTHHAVSPTHLHRYLAEFDFRYSTRDMKDSERTLRIIDQGAGRRLTYRPLAG
jgi:transposase-like protein